MNKLLIDSIREDGVQVYGEMPSELPRILKDVVPLEISDVAAHFYSGDDREYWNYAKDMPYAFPGVVNTFIEWEHPKYSVSDEYGLLHYDVLDDLDVRVGVLCMSRAINDPEDAPQEIQPVPEDAKWVMLSHLFIRAGDVPPLGPALYNIAFFNGYNDWCTKDNGDAFFLQGTSKKCEGLEEIEIERREVEEMQAYMMPMYFTFSCASANGIKVKKELRGKRGDYYKANYRRTSK